MYENIVKNEERKLKNAKFCILHFALFTEKCPAFFLKFHGKTKRFFLKY